MRSTPTPEPKDELDDPSTNSNLPVAMHSSASGQKDPRFAQPVQMPASAVCPNPTPPRRRIWLPTSSSRCWENRQIATGQVPLPKHEPAAPGSPPGQFASAVRPAGPSDPSRHPARRRDHGARDPAVGDRTPSHGFAKVPLHCKRLATWRVRPCA